MHRPTRVRHRKFGAGTVIGEDFTGADPKLEIEFDEHGRKKLLAYWLNTATDHAYPLNNDELSIAGVWLREVGPYYRSESFGVQRARPCDALRDWRTLQSVVDITRRWPVITSSPDDFVETTWERDREDADLRRAGNPMLGMPYLEHVADSPTEALALAENMSFESLLEDEAWAAEMRTAAANQPGEPDWLELDSALHRDSDQVLALVVTDAAWKVPAFLPHPGGNDCPARAQLVTFMRHYHERYDPRVVRLHYEFAVAVERRPESREEAEQLAFEHIRFCPDLLNTDRASFDSYAQHLLQSDYWSFWWD